MNETTPEFISSRLKRRFHPLLTAALLIPLLLLLLFFLLRNNHAFMDFWVFRILAPYAQFLGRLCSVFPFSVVELLITAAIAGSLFWLGHIIYKVLRTHDLGCCVLRLLRLGALWLWVLAIFYWQWNAVYYASTFSQRSGLSGGQHSIQELALVTDYFAWNAARLSVEVPRDGGLHFDVPLEQLISDGPAVYGNITKEFSFLEMKSVPVKPFLFSRLQSTMGFTGMYSPFTGEANINAEAPLCLIPSTIAHEMSHQRMVGPEQEANFVGIAACISSDNTVFQYSGWMSGLVHLSNALYSISPDAWETISRNRFTKELSTDWKDNIDYWRAFDSPVEEAVEKAADQAYDSFLKHNGQTLGMQSYGACIDLLITYYLPDILAAVS